MRSEKVCQEHVNQKQVTELEYENFENLIEKVLILRLRGMMTNLTFHLDLAKFFLSCSETVAWMFFSDCLPVIQQWSRAASHVSLTSTLTHMRDLMKSLASSLISSQQGESNSNSPGNINSYYSHKFLGEWRDASTEAREVFSRVAVTEFLTFQDLSKKVCIIFIVERRISTEEDVGDNAYTPHVHRFTVRLLGKDLGGHVARSPAGSGHHSGLLHLGQAEVADHDLAVRLRAESVTL